MSFAGEVVVDRVGDGCYVARLSHGWDLVGFPQGGVVVSFALRAAAIEVGDPALQLRTCTTVFAGQVAAGDLDIDVEILRRGRSATQLRATVRNRGASAGATTLAVYGAKRRGPTFVHAVPPDVPPPSQCRSYRDPLPDGLDAPRPTAFWTRVEGRAALGHSRWEVYEPERSDIATWLRFDEPPRLADGSLDPLGVLTLADRMPGCIGERIGHQDEAWFAPSADLTVHFFRPLHTEWLLAHDRARWADDGWASAETTLYDERGAVVAYATQMMLFTYPTPPNA